MRTRATKWVSGPALTVAPEVFARLAGIRVVVVMAEEIAPRRPADVAARWAAAWARVHEGFGFPNPQSHPHVAAWRAAMKGIGAPHKEFPTSVESLVRRAMKSAEPFRVDPLVDFYNAVCLEHVVPAGGFDLDALPEPLELRVTRAGDTFQALDAVEPEAVPPGEVAYAAGSAVVTRHLVWRQSRLGLVTPETRRAVLVSEILPAHGERVEPVRAALTEGLRDLFGARVSSSVLAEERAA